MHKFALILFLLLSGLSVHGQERLADIRPGAPCAAILELEQRLGSAQLSAQNANGISRYSGIQGGREAEIRYHCVDGSLTEQTVIVQTASRDEAYRFAHAQKIELARRLGDPIHDGLNLAAWRKLLFGILGGDLDYLTAVVVWGRADEDVMLSVREIDANLWQVSISQGRSKLEYIINS